MIGDAPLSKYTSVPGWETIAEEETLIYLAQTYVSNGGVVVELGGEYGRSASEFGYALKGKASIHIYTVDLFPDNHHLAKHYGGLWNVWRKNIAETGLCNENMEIVPVPGDTVLIAKDWHETIDLLFIDAGHTYQDVKNDIESWVKFVKAGGLIVFHDYAKSDQAHYLHQEVKRAVDEWYNNRTEKLERIDLPDSLIAFKKFEPSVFEKAADDARTPVASSLSTPEKPKTRKARKAK